MLAHDDRHPLERVFQHLNTSDELALVVGEEEFSYQDLKCRIAAAQKMLEAHPDEGVLIVAHDHVDTYAAILACWSLKKFYVPIHPNYPAERRAKIVEILNLDFFFDALAAPLIVDRTHHKLAFQKGLPSNAHCAYVLFTSGSTGEPKGVPITWGNLCAFESGFSDLGYQLDHQDRFLQMFDLTFDLSVMSFFIPLSMGASFYTVPPDSMKYAVIAELLEERALTFALMVPSILTYLRPYFEEIVATGLRYSLFCGEALHEDITAQWSACVPHAQIDNVYGPTENTIFCTRYTFKRDGANAAHQGVLSIGKPMKHTAVQLWNEEKEEVMNGEVGNLWLGGQYLTKGYLNREDLNQTQFVVKNNERWYNSGDRALRSDSGELLYMGRQDNQMKIQGFRIEAAEVEFHLKKCLPEGNRVVAVAVNNGRGITELVAISENFQWPISEVKQALLKYLPSYMVPSHYLDFPEFPLNSNGKIDRKQLTSWAEKKI